MGHRTACVSRRLMLLAPACLLALSGPAASDSVSLTVPIVISTAGLAGSFYTSELTLTNRGTTTATIRFTYTAAFGGGGGTATDTLAPGRQKTVSDALEYLISIGLPIPGSGNRGGVLRLDFTDLSSSDAGSATVRTTTAVAGGRAGLAYAAFPGGIGGTAYLCGLRQNDVDRSNVALLNAGAAGSGDVVHPPHGLLGRPGRARDPRPSGPDARTGRIHAVHRDPEGRGPRQRLRPDRAHLGRRAVLRVRDDPRPDHVRRLVRARAQRGGRLGTRRTDAPRGRRDPGLHDRGHPVQRLDRPPRPFASPTWPTRSRRATPRRRSRSRWAPASRSCRLRPVPQEPGRRERRRTGPTFAGALYLSVTGSDPAGVFLGGRRRPPAAADTTASSTRPSRTARRRRPPRGSSAFSRTPRTARISRWPTPARPTPRRSASTSTSTTAAPGRSPGPSTSRSRRRSGRRSTPCCRRGSRTATRASRGRAARTPSSPTRSSWTAARPRRPATTARS